MYLNDWRPFLLLAVNFALRAFTTGHLSPLKYVAKGIADQLRLAKKPVDAEPKKFAAALGMAFSIFIITFQLSGFILAANLVGAILIFCATLEAGFNICLGCIVYTYTVLPFHTRQCSINFVFFCHHPWFNNEKKLPSTPGDHFDTGT